jgi:uncharacterized membrane protein
MIVIVLFTVTMLVVMLVVTHHVSTAIEIRSKVGIRKRDTQQYIYFIQQRGIPLSVKIGRTNNYIIRLRQHNTTAPYGLIVLGIVVVKDCIGAERFLHRVFRENRIGREWFKITLLLVITIYYIRDDYHTRRANQYAGQRTHRFLRQNLGVQPQRKRTKAVRFLR